MYTDLWMREPDKTGASSYLPKAHNVDDGETVHDFKQHVSHKRAKIHLTLGIVPDEGRGISVVEFVPGLHSVAGAVGNTHTGTQDTTEIMQQRANIYIYCHLGSQPQQS